MVTFRPRAVQSTDSERRFPRPQRRKRGPNGTEPEAKGLRFTRMRSFATPPRCSVQPKREFRGPALRAAVGRAVRSHLVDNALDDNDLNMNSPGNVGQEFRDEVVNRG